MNPPGTRAHWIAVRICSKRTVESLVIPALADLQHEHREAADRGRWARAHVLLRGHWSLVGALTLHLATLPARHVRENWIGREAPGWQLVRPAAPPAAAVVVISSAMLLVDSLRSCGDWRATDNPTLLLRAALALLPSVLAITVPIGLLLGLALALRRLGIGPIPAPRWMAPAAGLSWSVAVVLFVLYGWMVPVANQAYREIVVRAMLSDSRPVAPGSRELTLSELTARLWHTRREGSAPSILVVEWHKKLAIPLAAGFLGPLAVGVTSRRSSWRRRGGGPLVAFVVISAFFLALMLGEQAALDGNVPPALGIWAAAAIPPLAACIALFARREEESAPSSPGV